MRTLAAAAALSVALAACSRAPDRPTDEAPPRSEVRGDPTPPKWATPDLGWAGSPVYARLYDAASPTLPADLSGSHLVCALTAITDGNPLDGARDLSMTWWFGDKTVGRHCAVDESPCIVGFGRGEVAVGMTLRVHAIDEDDPPDDDDDIATIEGRVEGGRPFDVETRELSMHCRAATPSAVREALEPLLHTKVPDLLSKVKGPDDGKVYAVRNNLVRAANLTGWDHPDVWPLVQAIDRLAPP
ncbi:MAG: hypothetical protein U1F43_05155 [Myxococcota bacterium]